MHWELRCAFELKECLFSRLSVRYARSHNLVHSSSLSVHLVFVYPALCMQHLRPMAALMTVHLFVVALCATLCPYACASHACESRSKLACVNTGLCEWPLVNTLCPYAWASHACESGSKLARVYAWASHACESGSKLACVNTDLCEWPLVNSVIMTSVWIPKMGCWDCKVWSGIAVPVRLAKFICGFCVWMGASMRACVPVWPIGCWLVHGCNIANQPDCMQSNANSVYMRFFLVTLLLCYICYIIILWGHLAYSLTGVTHTYGICLWWAMHVNHLGLCAWYVSFYELFFVSAFNSMQSLFE
jgi:hypothetical protein